MKKLLTLLAILIVTFTYSQERYTQKYNSLLDRVEIYNTYGQMVGFVIQDNLTHKILYYNAQGTLVKTETSDVFDNNRTNSYSSNGTSTGKTVYNEYLDRYEVFDASGGMVGYYYYDELLGEWKYVYR